MIRKSRRNNKSRKRLVRPKDNQTGGSPAYRLHGNLGLLSQSSLDYSPLGLTTYEKGFSDHIVSTSGGGRRRSRRRRSRSRRTRNRRKTRIRSRRN